MRVIIQREVSVDPLPPLPDPSPGPDVKIDQDRMRKLLDDILRQMPDALRDVYLLHDVEGLTMADIAEAQDLSRGTVASRLRRARQRIYAWVSRLDARRKHRGFDRQLLATGRREAPSERAQKKVMASVLAAMADAFGSSTAGASVLLVKWLGIGLLIGAAAIGGSRLLLPPDSQPDAMMAPTGVDSPPQIAVPVEQRSAPVATPDERAKAAAALPAARAVALRARPSSPAISDELPAEPLEEDLPEEEELEGELTEDKPSPPAAPHNTMSAERKMVSEARALRRSGQPGRALAVLNEYWRKYAKPHFRPEATLIHLKALLDLGRRDEARALLNHNPNIPLSPHLRSLLSEP